MSDEYEAPWKQMAWETFWAGYKEGRDVEAYDAVDRRMALSKFEREWERNHE